MGSRDAERQNKAPLPRLAIPLLAVLVGVALGLGLFTLHHAEALSYLSTDPAACANCHIMQSQYDSWQKSSHHTVATCVDCHLPHDFIGKYVAKTENGWHHSKGFTLQDFHEPIMIKSKNALILQRNCLACHGAIAHGLVEGVNGEPDEVQCVHCHVDVGHGETTGLGGPEREQEIEAARREAADASQGKTT
jgi:cytochrome c nitrite reductase small subunit